MVLMHSEIGVSNLLYLLNILLRKGDLKTKLLGSNASTKALATRGSRTCVDIYHREYRFYTLSKLLFTPTVLWISPPKGKKKKRE